MFKNYFCKMRYFCLNPELVNSINLITNQVSKVVFPETKAFAKLLATLTASTYNC